MNALIFVLGQKRRDSPGKTFGVRVDSVSDDDEVLTCDAYRPGFVYCKGTVLSPGTSTPHRSLCV